MDAGIVVLVAAVGALTEFGADQAQILHRAGGAGLGAAEADAGGIAREGAGRGADEGVAGLEKRALRLGVNPLEAHAREREQPVVEEPRVTLEIDARGDFLERLRTVDTGLLRGHQLRGRLGEESRVSAPRLDHAVGRSPGNGLLDPVVGVAAINLHGERRERGVGGIGRIVGVAERLPPVVAVLDAEEAAALQGDGHFEQAQAALHVEVEPGRVVGVIAIRAGAGGVETEVAQVEEVDLAVVGVEHAGDARALGADVLEIHAYAGGRQQAAAEAVEVALHDGAPPSDGLRGVSAGVDQPLGALVTVARVGAEGLRVVVEKIRAEAGGATPCRAARKVFAEGERHAGGDRGRCSGADAGGTLEVAVYVAVIVGLHAEREDGVGGDAPVEL